MDNIQKPVKSPDCLFGVATQPTDSQLSETSHLLNRVTAMLFSRHITKMLFLFDIHELLEEPSGKFKKHSRVIRKKNSRTLNIVGDLCGHGCGNLRSRLLTTVLSK